MCAAVSDSVFDSSSRRRDLRSPVVAVVGATGAVGREMIECLHRRKFPLRSLRLLASARSAGQALKYGDRSIVVEALNEQTLDGIDIALFSAGGSVSKQYAPLMAQRGTIVVDNSSAFRMNDDVPLVVPEINPQAIAQHRGIIANPNCVAILSVTPLWPIHQANPIRRLILSTYQAASGAGAAAMEELRESTRAYLAGESYEPKVLPHPYAFNVFSHNAKVDPATGYNDEEAKVMQEARKIFGDATLLITATCVRVPVLRAHCVSVNFECENRISPEDVRRIIDSAPGVRLVDDPLKNYYPMPNDASGRDELLVGRIRQDVSDPSNRSISMFIAGDQLLKGAALNAVQIAETLVKG